MALDRWAIARTRELQQEIATAYRDYAFHLIYQKVHNFCVVDLGGFYLDILKDRLYTTPAASRARRSAQTAMWHIAESMVRWLAPILSFTAEEMWRHLRGQRAESVFLSTWHELPAAAAPMTIDWPALIALRGDVARELERLRIAGTIGAPLDAELDVWCTPQQYRTPVGAGCRAALPHDHLRGASARSRRQPCRCTAARGGAGRWASKAAACGSRCCPSAHASAYAAGSIGRRGRVAQNIRSICGRCVGNLHVAGRNAAVLLMARDRYRRRDHRGSGCAKRQPDLSCGYPRS